MSRTEAKLIINRIELSVFDESGKLAHRTFLDEYSRNNLELKSHPSVEKKRSILIFNPFHTFATRVPLKKLRYDFSFSTEDRTKYYKSQIDVAPVIYQTKTNLILPVRGRVLIWDGHDYNSHHRRWDYTDAFFIKRGSKTNYQRYGYDFVIVDDEGQMYRGQPKNNDDWYQGRMVKNERL